jgi:hypothetical protein
MKIKVAKASISELETQLASIQRVAEQYQNEAGTLTSQLARSEADAAAVRELMNVYNLGGWTDAEAPMKRALLAEKSLALAVAALKYVDGKIGHFAKAPHDDQLAVVSLIGDLARTVKETLAQIEGAK